MASKNFVVKHGITVGGVEIVNSSGQITGQALTSALSGISAGATISSITPSSPSAGALWLDTNSGKLFVYINDGDSSQWMQPTVPAVNMTGYATVQFVNSSVEVLQSEITPIQTALTGINTSLSGLTTTVTTLGTSVASVAPIADPTFSGMVTIGEGSSATVTDTLSPGYADYGGTNNAYLAITPSGSRVHLYENLQVGMTLVAGVNGQSFSITILSITVNMGEYLIGFNDYLPNNGSLVFVELPKPVGLTVSTGKINLGAVGNIKISGGSANQVLTTNGNGGLSWAPSGGGSGLKTYRTDGIIGGFNTDKHTSVYLVDNSLTPSQPMYIGLNTITFDGAYDGQIVNIRDIGGTNGNINTAFGNMIVGDFELPAYGTKRFVYSSEVDTWYDLDYGNKKISGALTVIGDLSANAINASSLGISGAGTLGSISVSGTSGFSGVMAAGTINATTLSVSGTTTIAQTIQKITSPNISANAVTLDFSSSANFALSSNSANITVNYTNIPSTPSGFTITSTLIITQGATAYIPNVLKINTATQTIKWTGGATPSGTANKTNVVTFTIICTTTNTFTVLGSLATYG